MYKQYIILYLIILLTNSLMIRDSSNLFLLMNTIIEIIWRTKWSRKYLICYLIVEK